MSHIGCPLKCSCPSSPPSCPPGISSVLDSCGCCRVCARQFNQDCSPAEPCDHIKGLRCHLKAGGDPNRGLCRAEAQGRPCELDGRVYQHGEDFQPTCEHQCTCVDGVVGCVPLCPHHISLPDWRCSRRRLTKLPGRCCQEWVCDDDNRIAEVEPLPDAHPQEHTDLTGNELLVAPSTSWDSSATAPYQGKKCQKTTRSPKPVQIVFAGCFTARRYRPRSCGSCSDGRLCIPSVTRTIPLHFHCPEPERDDFTRNVMWIQRCSCSQRNSRQGLSSQAEFFNLPNDIHTYTH
uniref:Cellular communication network factor 1, like 1 n=1 Tax=Cyprinus carpio TaxID=7962 RepID=A0A8C1TM47_CYPCA